MIKKKKKYIAVFLLKDQDSYAVQKKKRFNPSIKKEVRYRNKLYHFKNLIPSFSIGLKSYFCIDIDKTTGHLLFKEKTDSLITPELLDDIISSKVVQQLTSNLTDSQFRMNLMYIIIGGVIGGLIGWIAGGI